MSFLIEPEPMEGICRACDQHMTLDAFITNHQKTHDRHDFPLLPDGTRAIFAQDAYDLSNDAS